jgi:3-oxoacyl-[acyl-carrier-protein] synthase III
MITRIHIVDSYIRAGLIKRGMVVSGEYVTHLIQNAQLTIGKGIDPQLASLTVGDSGAAVIIEATDDSNLGFQYIDLFTAAQFCDLCIGTTNSEEHGGYVMNTDSIRILSEGINISLHHIGDMLRSPACNTMRFDWICFHQVSSRATHKLANDLNERFQRDLCTHDNTVDNVKERGNTSSTSHFVALWDYILNGKIRSYQNLLIACQASGMVFGVMAYSFDDLPDRIVRNS